MGSALGVALGISTLGLPAGVGASALVSAIVAATHEGRLEVEIRGSEPLNYLLMEGADPFTVSLLLLNATFAFPAVERELPGPGLQKIRTAVLEREGSRLGRLDLTFASDVAYRIVKEGSRLLVRVDVPAPAGRLALGQESRDASPRPVRAVARDRPAPAAFARIVELRPEVEGDTVRVIVEADGPLAYKSSVLEQPYRVVVDFERAQLSSAEDTVEVGTVPVRRIRSSQFTPTTVRVVLDLTRPTPYWIEARADGVVIHLGAARRR